MDELTLRALLGDFKEDRLGLSEVVSLLNKLPYQDLGFAKIDSHRALRKGFPEVIFGQGKSPSQIAKLAIGLLGGFDRCLVTKAEPEAFSAVLEKVPDATYDEIAHTIVVDRRDERKLVPGVVVVSGGTSDIPVADEATITATLMDCQVERIYDVGVAGIHRLFDQLTRLQEARVIVAVAGMEGALPSVIGGLVSAPIIAVPTSVGYGSSFGGLTALLAMLNGCAPGVAVVNIDNGFGAGYMAASILNRTSSI